MTVKTLTWDYREQPDLAALAAAVAEVSGGTVRIREIETGSDQYEIVIERSDPAAPPERPYYVVAVIGAASGQIEDLLASQVLHFNPEDAGWERDLHTDKADQAGRRDRYIVCEVRPVKEDDHG